jgi:hypothetical protein
MTNHVARLYALATSLIVFFAVWLAVSAHPWSATVKAAPTGDPQMVRLMARERRLRAQTRNVNLIVHRRYAAYRRALRQRNRVNATARAHHIHQLVAAHRAAVAAQKIVAAPTYSPAVAAPPAVRIVTLPPVTSTRTS